MPNIKVMDMTGKEVGEIALPKTYGEMAKNGTQVIAPSRKGEAGTENLNLILQGMLNPAAPDRREHIFRERRFREGDRVMQTRNNYDIAWSREGDGQEGNGIFNGDIGIVQTIQKAEGRMEILFDDRLVSYEMSQLEDLEHAYAITVHKSQGSEYPIVIIPMCSAAQMLLSRNLLYTAVTRAQSMVILVGREEIVREMVDILDSKPEYDVVAAYQDRRGEGKILSFFKKSFYSLINRLSKITLKSDASDFRTFRRSVAESILAMGEYHRFSKGIFAWVGYETYFVPYTACKRTAGESKWNFHKLVNYAIDGIIGYSTQPLRIATYLGSCAAVTALIYLIVVVLQKLITGIDIPGYATIIVLILFFGSLQLFCIGIIGEYVGRTFEQSKDRPIYIAKEILDYEQ